MHKKDQEKRREENRLAEVMLEIDRKKKEILLKSGDIKESVLHLRKDFWGDVTVNLDNVDEMVETQASIRQQAELLSERERSHGQLHEQLKKLKQLEDYPYFGRIDFKEEGERTDRIYIGRASLMDEEELEFLVYDWRAPISSMYYDFAPGKAYFDTMEGKIEGEILLKRQYIINRGKLEGMFDTGLTIGDQLLQRALGGQASTQMKSIVATIQREQNRVIRHERKKYLIVQGAAGSGKTSAALQRVAYLLYRHRHLLNEENMLLFSPNELFSSYVSEVLPELGEEKIQQRTFLKFIDRNIRDLKVESPFEQMEYMLAGRGDSNYPVRQANIAFKSSVQYKDVIDSYLAYLNQEGLVFNDFLFRGESFVSGKEMKDYFIGLGVELPLQNKVSLLARWLEERIESLKERELKEDWVIDEIELLDDDVLTGVYHELQEREEMEEFYDSGVEERFLQEKIVDKAIEPLGQKLRDFEFINLIKTYENMFSLPMEGEDLPENWQDLSEFTLKNMEQGWLSWEEATAFSYFADKIIGSRANRSIRHIIIDEAQDYTPFQMAYLQTTFPHTNFTILGDINQAIYAETDKGNPLSMATAENLERINLRKSYRSTKQIIEFTRAFAPNGEGIEAFEREGEKPRLIQTSEDQWLKLLKEEIKGAEELGHETIGLVCQSKGEASFLHEQLAKEIDCQLIHEKTKKYRKGVSILPIYLAKGIEFDAVIIPDASKEVYTERDRTLFYTACTRAMHRLVLITRTDWTSFIGEAGEENYEIL